MDEVNPMALQSKWDCTVKHMACVCCTTLEVTEERKEEWRDKPKGETMQI